MILPARKLTWPRWWHLSTMRLSLLRALEYERIQGLCLQGLTLDVGGGVRNSYLHLLDIRGEVESVNIDKSMQPTYLADLNGVLPIPSDRYDHVISLNTLEHVADDRNALNEVIRVLKPEGKAHIVVPFLYRVHGSPSDFHRHTANAWEAMLAEAGFDSSTVSVEPLAFGRYSCAFALAEYLLPLPIRWTLKKLVMACDILMERLWQRGWREYDMPMGYFIEASKGQR